MTQSDFDEYLLREVLDFSGLKLGLKYKDVIYKHENIARKHNLLYRAAYKGYFKGYSYLQDDCLGEALEYLLIAREDATFEDNSIMVCMLNCVIGIIHLECNRIYEAMDYYLLALEADPSFNSSLSLRVQTGIGLSYDALGEYDKAYDFFKESLNIALKSKDASDIILTSTNLALNSIDNNIPKAVIPLITYAKKHLHRTGNTKRHENMLNFALGTYHLYFGSEKKGIDILEEALDFLNNMKLTTVVIDVYFRLGKYFLEQENYPKALEYLEPVESLLLSTSISREEELYLLMIKVLKGMKDIRAYNYLKKYNDLSKTTLISSERKEIALTKSISSLRTKTYDINMDLEIGEQVRQISEIGEDFFLAKEVGKVSPRGINKIRKIFSPSFIELIIIDNNRYSITTYDYKNKKLNFKEVDSNYKESLGLPHLLSRKDSKRIYNNGSSLTINLDHEGDILGAFTIVDTESEINFLRESLFRQLCIYISTIISINKNNEKLENISTYDYLTGVYNRRYLNNIEGSIGSKVVSIIDIDYYKEYNDIYGHIEGDRVLVIISKLLREHTSGEVFRYGGDEFVIIGDYRLTEELENLLDIIEDKNIPHRGSLLNRLSLSIGIAKEKDFITSLNIADTNLYISKNNGRNQITSTLEKESNQI